MTSFKKVWVSAVLGGALCALSANAETIHQRKENQQDRIAQGVGSGQLTAGETAHLEHQEKNLNREIRHDRNTGGGLNAHERATINRQQNHLSREIYRDKHNGRTQ